MLEEIQRRNFTESTTRAYLRIIEDFARVRDMKVMMHEFSFFVA
jgi:hypothetical protein